VELFREALNHAIKQILLRHGIFGPLNELQQFWQDDLLVNFYVQTLQTADSHQVLANQHF
jgi:hypothetical protein